MDELLLVARKRAVQRFVGRLRRVVAVTLALSLMWLLLVICMSGLGLTIYSAAGALTLWLLLLMAAVRLARPAVLAPINPTLASTDDTAEHGSLASSVSLLACRDELVLIAARKALSARLASSAPADVLALGRREVAILARQLSGEDTDLIVEIIRAAGRACDLRLYEPILRLSEVRRTQFPSEVAIQSEAARVAEQMSAAHREGWHTLLRPPESADSECDQLLHPDL